VGKEYLYYKKMIEDCCSKQKVRFVSVSEEELRRNLSLIDEYTDAVIDTFTFEGMDENYEPNEYGLELKDVAYYLLEMRYALVD